MIQECCLFYCFSAKIKNKNKIVSQTNIRYHAKYGEKFKVFEQPLNIDRTE